MVNSVKRSVLLAVGVAVLVLPSQALAVGEVTKTFDGPATTTPASGFIRSSIDIADPNTNQYIPKDTPITDINLSVYYTGPEGSTTVAHLSNNEVTRGISDYATSRGIDCAGGQTTFDDEATTRIEDTVDPLAVGSFKPRMAGEPMVDVDGEISGMYGLNNFYGTPVENTWVLTMTAGSPDVVLHCWSVSITYQGDGFTDCDKASDDLDVRAVACTFGKRMERKGKAFARKSGYKCHNTAYQGHKLTTCRKERKAVRYLR